MDGQEYLAVSLSDLLWKIKQCACVLFWGKGAASCYVTYDVPFSFEFRSRFSIPLCVAVQPRQPVQPRRIQSCQLAFWLVPPKP